MIFYTVFFFFGYRVYYQQTFVWPSALWWQGWDKGEHDLMDPGEREYGTRWWGLDGGDKMGLDWTIWDYMGLDWTVRRSRA